MALVLGLTVAGFIVARLDAERGARHNSEQRVEIAAAQIRTRVEVATSLTESLRRFMLDEGATGVTDDEFARNALRWLSPADLSATAWAEEVRAADRAGYEGRIGQPIVAPDDRLEAVPPGSSYLPATLVSGFPPMNSRGVDLRRELGIPAALRRAIRPGGVGATPVAARRDGTRGLFLVAPVPNLIDGVFRAGAVVVFVSEATLRAAARNPVGLRFGGGGGDTVREEFKVAGQRFAVVMPEESVSGAGAALPWIILAGGLLLAGLVGALGVIAARRARAQQDFDRIFNLSPDLVAVADFDGHFKRVNPAAEQILGYTEEELLSRPYLDLVHPDDRESTAAEAAAIGEGKRALSFENRFARKDGSYRVLEWTSAPVVEERTAYSVARDVTERRQAEAEAKRLADEQAALRRVATVVAGGGSRAEVFGAVAEELRQLFGDSLVYMFSYENETVVAVASAGIVQDVLPVGSRHELGGNNAATHVLRTGEPVRIDDYAAASGPIAEAVRKAETRSVVGTPIVVDDGLWGVMVLGTTSDDPLPPETESRLGQFTELMATAIANTEARAEVERLADEQAALRRVATLVARESPPGEVFAKIAEQAGKVLGGVDCVLCRDEGHGTFTVVAAWGDGVVGTIRVGERLPVDRSGVVARVLGEGRPCRIDDYSTIPGTMAERGRRQGLRSAAGCPIVVRGRLWGAVAAAKYDAEPMPAETERRMVQFAELAATAIANAEARAEVKRLADEQAALRRAATLVAEHVPPSDLFAAVTEEVGKLLGADLSGMIRYNDDGTISPVAAWAAAGEHPPLPSSWSTQEGDPATMVAEAGGPVRVDQWNEVPGPMAALIRELGIRSSVGSPISVEGRLWGALAVHSYSDQPLPVGTESRLVSFTELVATAMANAEARGEVERLAQEQAALRRVATLVAEGAPPAAVFDAVAGEMEALLDADQVALNRFEPGDEIVVLAHRGLDVDRTPVGSRLSVGGENVTATVRRIGRPARMENYDEAQGPLAELARATGLRSSVSAPIVVEGRLWGLITASWKGEQLPPSETEQRMSRFAQLLDTAIANADARAELVASRARLVAASDEARRRFERDLHDGVQQRLVLLSLEVRGAEAMAPPGGEELVEQLAEVQRGLAEALDDLRELSRGIHPAILSEGGLVPALKALGRRSAVPVQLDLAIEERLAEHVEIGAYYVVSEAITNAAKHASASKVEVHARARDGVLELTIDDDGVGGADPSRGSGLTGLADRVEALGGTIWIASPPGEGTSLRVALSLDGQ